MFSMSHPTDAVRRMNAHGTTLAVVLEKPEQLVLSRLALTDAGRG